MTLTLESSTIVTSILRIVYLLVVDIADLTCKFSYAERALSLL